MKAEETVAEPQRVVDAGAVLEIVTQVAAELHPTRKKLEGVSLDASLDRDLGFDSLGRAELLSRLERTFAVGLPETLLATAETPRDLLRAVDGAGAPAARGPRAPEPAVAAPGKAGAAPAAARTLVEVVEWHVERHRDRRHVLLLSGDETPQEMTYGELHDAAHKVAAGLRELHLEPAETVALMLPTSREYFAAFLGILLAGGVPVPLYPPVRPSQIEDHLRRQAGILDTAQVRILITLPEVRPLARLLRAQVQTLRRVVTVAEVSAAEAATELPAVRENDVAFLQFTSGSTAEPKGVILTHGNLLANLRAIGDWMALGSDDSVVSWLPLYHDMGLIGAWMGSLTYAMPLVLMSPLAFLTRPSRWLWAVHRYRGTLSAAPNFAYELCLKKIGDDEIEGLDLSSWRSTLNGAEPISAATLRRFSERFSRYGLTPNAVMPVYGLAEGSLGLAFPPRQRRPVVDVVDREALTGSGRAEPAAEGEAHVLRFVSCGAPLPGHEIRIVDATGSEVGERHEGRLEFRGPSATSGYFRNPEATRRLFRGGEWLDSGDMAYMAGGEVYITGRAKDMIIRAGRNIYPQELEEAVGALPGVRKGCVAVFGSTDADSGTERLVILAETREDDEEAKDRLAGAIQELAVDLVGTPADDVILAPPHTVPKTSSGKIRRAAGRELYEQGRLGSKGPVWWQLTRLAWAGARPQLSRAGRAARDLVYAGRFWTVVGLAAIPVVAGVVALPRLARRRRLARRAARGVARLAAIPIRVSGLEHLEGARPVIVAANHMSYLDGFALTAALPTEGAFLAKNELEQRFLARLLLERLGTIFVERIDPEKGLEDTERAIAALGRGESLLFFPEGTLRRAPGLRPFRLGAFYVAARTGTPVVPVALRGTRSLLRDTTWFPRRGSVTVTVRPPVLAEGSDLAAAARLRDAVREEILRHCGEPDLMPTDR